MDINSIRENLSKLIREMPTDFALSEARHHLKIALSNIDHVEKKRVRREQVVKFNEEQEQEKRARYHPNALTAIDKMIDEQKSILAEIQDRKARNKKKKDGGDEDVQAIFG